MNKQILRSIIDLRKTVTAYSKNLTCTVVKLNCSKKMKKVLISVYGMTECAIGLSQYTGNRFLMSFPSFLQRFPVSNARKVEEKSTRTNFKEKCTLNII